MRSGAGNPISEDLKYAGNLILFARVIKSGGVTQCAHSTGLGRSTISRRISDLERKVGTRLLERESGGVSPTAFGKEYFDRALSLIQILGDSTRSTPREIVVSAPAAVFDSELEGVLRRFERSSRWPNRIVRDARAAGDSGKGRGVDLCIDWRRRSELPGPTVRLSRVKRATYASPELVRTHGLPEAPSGLKKLPCMASETDEDLEEWHFRHRGKLVRVRIRADGICDDPILLRGAALAGEGVARLPAFVAEQFVRCGRLVQILTDFETAPGYLSVTTNGDSADSWAVTSLRLFLEENLQFA